MKRKHKGKQTRIMMVLGLMFLFSVALAMSSYADTATLNDPTTSGTVDGTGIDFNVSFTVAEDAETVNCAVTGSSSSTANSTSSVIFNLTNSTSGGDIGDGKSVNYTLASSDVVEDAADWSFTPTCYNSTGEFSGSASTSVTVDRTTPSTPASVQPGDVTQKNKTLDFVASVTGTDTTSCTLTFDGTNPGQSTYSMTHSGDTCTQTINNVAEGNYKYTITASDGTDDSATSTFSTTVDVKGSGARKAKILSALGGSADREGAERGLSIAQAQASGNNQGLERAMAAVQKEFTREELTKTGIGVGAGAASGFIAGMFVPIPGAPIVGAVVGGAIGVMS